jgi:hypothetical protein
MGPPCLLLCNVGSSRLTRMPNLVHQVSLASNFDEESVHAMRLNAAAAIFFKLKAMLMHQRVKYIKLAHNLGLKALYRDTVRAE